MTRNPTFLLDIGWQPLLTDLGLSPRQILHTAGLPEALFSDTSYRLTPEQYFRFWRVLETESQDPLLPLSIVKTLSVESFNPPLFAALCSSHLMQAVQRLARYKPLIGPMNLELKVSPTGTLTLIPGWLSVQTEIPDSLQITEIAFFLQLVRLASRHPVKALRVSLPQPLPKACAEDYQAFFGVAVRYAEQPSITFSAEDAWRPFLTVNQGMWRVFEPDLRRRLSEIDAAATTSERVHAVLLELLPGNTASLATTAKRLGLSPRTLQRRLEGEGQNFRALVNTTRGNLARHYLRNTEISGAEIAFLLGFEDPNSFYRAFQDWTGQTPDHARDSLRLN